MEHKSSIFLCGSFSFIYHELLELSQGLWAAVAPQCERVTRAEAVLQVLRRSQALKNKS